MKKGLLLCIIGLLGFVSPAISQDEVLLGAKLGSGIPLNIFNNKMPYGFYHMARPGFLGGFTTKWFYGQRLSLGAELGYQYFPGNSNYWDVEHRGDVSAQYQSVSLIFSGNYYFSHDAIRPYCGIAFGAWYLFNDMVFASSNQGTDGDASLQYRSELLKPGFAPEAGLLFELNRNTYVELSVRLVLIPNIPEDEVIIYPNGWPREINKNPHVNQHHIQVAVALFFEK
jgi:hypothetical protein